MTEEQDGGLSREEAIAMLKAGKVDEWNEYRLAHRDWRPHLSDANLGRAHLSHANLSNANLGSANLINARLRSANLSSADLLSANLSNARLSSANLSSADLSNTNLTRASFGGADLSDARFGFTSFGRNDLSEAKGLDTVRHAGPSFVDIHTLLVSQGKIPQSFLRGCGMPEPWIDYLPVLLESVEPIQFYSCFISHSSMDQSFADNLYHALIKAKVRVWYAPEDMRGGRKSRAQIDQAIRLHDKLLIVLSPQSIDSEWVKTEIREARQKEIETGKRVLFPIALMRIDDIREWEFFDADRGEDLAIEVREYHIPDFREWENDEAFAREFDRLIDDLKADEKLEPEKSK